MRLLGPQAAASQQQQPLRRWTCGQAACSALRQAAAVSAALLTQADRPAAAAAVQAARLHALAAASCESHRGALLAEQVGSPARRAAWTAFCGAREEALRPLLPVSAAEAARGEWTPLSALASLAATHGSYAVLAAACEQFGDGSASLHAHMRTLRPWVDEAGSQVEAEGGSGPACFRDFVFARLLRAGRLAELLTLPDDFLPPLLHFLRDRPELCWPLELRLQLQPSEEAHAQAGGGAAKTLLWLSSRAPTLRASRRALALAKLAAELRGDCASAAAAEAGAGLARVRVHVQLLAASAGLGTRAALAAAPVSIASLVEAALSARVGPAQAARLAFEALSTAPCEFGSTNIHLVEAAWKASAAGTDWQALAALQENAADLAFVDALAASSFFSCARAAYVLAPQSAAAAVPPEAAARLAASAVPVASNLAEAALSAAFNYG